MTSKEGKSSGSLACQLEQILAPRVESMGYELVSVEYQNKSPQGGALVRVFIEKENDYIGIEDCVRVDHGLNDLFENPDFDSILAKDFTLEVSSPGVDRPLTKQKDYAKFAGKKARIKTYRALELAELDNPNYFEHHKKQKNFIGILLGTEGDAVFMEIDREKIKIPFQQIAKANLEISDELLQASSTR